MDCLIKVSGFALCVNILIGQSILDCIVIVYERGAVVLVKNTRAIPTRNLF